MNSKYFQCLFVFIDGQDRVILITKSFSMLVKLTRACANQLEEYHYVINCFYFGTS